MALGLRRRNDRIDRRPVEGRLGGQSDKDFGNVYSARIGTLRNETRSFEKINQSV